MNTELIELMVGLSPVQYKKIRELSDGDVNDWIQVAIVRSLLIADQQAKQAEG